MASETMFLARLKVGRNGKVKCREPRWSDDFFLVGGIEIDQRTFGKLFKYKLPKAKPDWSKLGPCQTCVAKPGMRCRTLRGKLALKPHKERKPKEPELGEVW